MLRQILNLVIDLLASRVCVLASLRAFCLAKIGVYLAKPYFLQV